MKHFSSLFSFCSTYRAFRTLSGQFFSPLGLKVPLRHPLLLCAKNDNFSVSDTLSITSYSNFYFTSRCPADCQFKPSEVFVDNQWLPIGRILRNVGLSSFDFCPSVCYKTLYGFTFFSVLKVNELEIVILKSYESAMALLEDFPETKTESPEFDSSSSNEVCRKEDAPEEFNIDVENILIAGETLKTENFDVGFGTETGSAAEFGDRHHQGVECAALELGADKTESDDNVELAGPYDEKLCKFRAKLASNCSVLPTELLQKVTDIVAKCPSLANSESVASESLQVLKEALPQDSRAASATLSEEKDNVDGEGKWHKEQGSAISESEKKKYNKKKKKTEAQAKENFEKPRRIAPNCFVAIQVTNPEIHKKIEEIQNMVVDKEPLLKTSLVNLPTLHLTVMVLLLKDEEEIKRAKTALDKSSVKILEQGSSTLELPFAGIGDFQKSVVFAKVKDGQELEQLKNIADIVRDSFAEEDLFSTDKRGFEAHMTIMKLSKDPRLFKKIKRINPAMYSELKDDFLGTQSVQSVQLCEMKKAANGYYPIMHEVFFDQP